MHKLLRVIFGVLKSGIPYDDQVDIDNQKKYSELNKQEAEKNKKSDSSRRYQQEAVKTAPVSNRNAKKRRSSSSHQSTKSGAYGVMEKTPTEI